MGNPNTPRIQIASTLGSKVYKGYLLWAIWSLRGSSIWVQGLDLGAGFRVQGLGFRMQGLDLGCRVQGLGCLLGFRMLVQGNRVAGIRARLLR